MNNKWYSIALCALLFWPVVRPAANTEAFSRKTAHAIGSGVAVTASASAVLSALGWLYSTLNEQDSARGAAATDKNTPLIARNTVRLAPRAVVTGHGDQKQAPSTKNAPKKLSWLARLFLHPTTHAGTKRWRAAFFTSLIAALTGGTIWWVTNDTARENDNNNTAATGSSCQQGGRLTPRPAGPPAPPAPSVRAHSAVTSTVPEVSSSGGSLVVSNVTNISIPSTDNAAAQTRLARWWRSQRDAQQHRHDARAAAEAQRQRHEQAQAHAAQLEQQLNNVTEQLRGAEAAMTAAQEHHQEALDDERSYAAQQIRKLSDGIAALQDEKSQLEERLGREISVLQQELAAARRSAVQFSIATQTDTPTARLSVPLSPPAPSLAPVSERRAAVPLPPVPPTAGITPVPLLPPFSGAGEGSSMSAAGDGEGGDGSSDLSAEVAVPRAAPAPHAVSHMQLMRRTYNAIAGSDIKVGDEVALYAHRGSDVSRTKVTRVGRDEKGAYICVPGHKIYDDTIGMNLSGKTYRSITVWRPVKVKRRARGPAAIGYVTNSPYSQRLASPFVSARYPVAATAARPAWNDSTIVPAASRRPASAAATGRHEPTESVRLDARRRHRTMVMFHNGEKPIDGAGLVRPSSALR